MRNSGVKWRRSGDRIGGLLVVVTAAVCLLGGMVGFVASTAGALGATTTLYVDNVNGTATTGCLAPGTDACATIQEAVLAAEALTGTAVTVDVAGSAMPYDEMVTVNIPPSSTDTLTLQGTGATQPVLDDGGAGTNLTISGTSTAPITINNFTISGGSAVNGAGIQDIGTGTLTLNDDTVSQNTATNNAGGVDVGDGCAPGATTGVLVATDTTFSNNTVTNGDGGAIDDGDCTGTANVTISDSTFSSNSAGTAGSGGALAGWAGNQTLTNVTFVGNSAGFGGAVLSESGATTLNFATFSGNSSALDAYEHVTVSNSILAASTLFSNCQTGSNVVDGGYNVSSDSSCNLGSDSMAGSTTIGALALAANGSTGPQTAAITPASSAYHLVPLTVCITTDERGEPRPGIGSDCDAGAFEIQSASTPPATSVPNGYDIVGADGGVYAFGDAVYHGSLPGLGIKVSDVVGIALTSDGGGYYLAGRDGGVYAFGDAKFHGSLPGLGVPVHNIIGIATTPDGGGYWLAGRNGGVYAFGDAVYHGSLPGLGVKVGDVVGIAPTPDGGGYYLAGRDGGVYAFGDARFRWSLPGMGISVHNITGIATTPDGGGYWLAGRNGGVYAFGDAVYLGSLPGLGVSACNIVSIVRLPTGSGYWLGGSNGGVYAFAAPFYGSIPGLGLQVKHIVGAAYGE